MSHNCKIPYNSARATNHFKGLELSILKLRSLNFDGF